jgi:hypothetical protein
LGSIINHDAAWSWQAFLQTRIFFPFPSAWFAKGETLKGGDARCEATQRRSPSWDSPDEEHNEETAMTYRKHATFSITAEGVIERGCSELPSAVRLPAVSVTLAPDASAQATARLLRRLADELEGTTIWGRRKKPGRLPSHW